ncbi:hypothetical protein GFY24_33090 [Nocardia sp. SYP-A9097]|uniref:hypothetical protein n=1 Tax=Nocardia sp. SYP-A9097 TaxID=2663237 RepID=UPI00129A9DFA|nr:hypothetical protein [Nocardia sp. SYP-A9097]MRH92215.1 hypothetical protein [Nocardia sp. SYP-A9097]
MGNIGNDGLEIAITVGVAVGSALLQVMMKAISRTEITGKKHGLTRDDALFWTDWSLAGSLALAGSLLLAAHQDKSVPVSEMAAGFLVVLCSCSGLPLFLRIFAYEPNAKLKEIPPKGIGWVLIANIFGILVLASCVVVGVKVYDWK